MLVNCIAISLVHALVAAIEPGCENCACCFDKICADKFHQGHTINEYCTHGCSDGYSGDKCYSKCPDDCVSCEQYMTSNCETCKVGKYLTTKEKRCIDCTTTCKSCTSSTMCQECNPPYYNDGDITDCSLACPSTCKDTCHKTTGQCLSCEIGQYGTLCQYNCSKGCKDSECDYETGSCLECLSLYSGNRCCIQNGFCKVCLSNTVCKTCADGYFGDSCNKACPAMCTLVEGKTVCDRTTGICAACGDGFHGEFCSSVCSSFCLKNQCNKDTGHCSQGCVDGHGGPTCTDVLAVSYLSVAGISSAVIFVMITITIVISVIILRKRRRKLVKQQQKYQEQVLQTSNVNTEAQPTVLEMVNPEGNIDNRDVQEYEELPEVNLEKSDDYVQM